MGDTKHPMLLSVALDVPARPSSDFFGHEIVYQQALIDTARSQGVDGAIVVPYASWSQQPHVVCLPVDGVTSWVDGLHQLLTRSTDAQRTVLFYEGSLEVASIAAVLAEHHPEVVFVVNLFHRDPELALPSLSQRHLGRGLHLRRIEGDAEQAVGEHAALGDRPGNLLLYADTERRKVLAASLGLQDLRTWPLYSVLDVGDAADAERPVGSAVRVVVPVAGRQATRQLMYELAVVVRLTRRYAPRGRSYEWFVFGGGYEGGLGPRSRRRRMRRLRRLGIAYEPSGLDGDHYVRTLTHADVVWLPQRGIYTTQSSGKAADALVCGTPVLAPNGSFAAQEMERWVPGAPAYTSAREAVEILLRAGTILPSLRASLSARSQEVRWWYSPQRAVASVLDASATARLSMVGVARQTSSVNDAGLPAPSSLRKARKEPAPAKLQRVTGDLVTQLRADLYEFWTRLRTLLQLR